jgi:[ribosomal protein S5]-alanine N-acetyltransferase
MKACETNRLILKTLDKTYASLVVDYYLRNKDFLKEWISLRDESFYTIEFQEKHLEEDLINASNNTSLRLWVFDKDRPDKIIGTIAFNNILWGSSLSCQIGYRLDKDEINKGYITEAASRGIDVMFNDYKLHRIEANIMPRNEPSLRVAKKLGFVKEGILHKYIKINGKWQDHIHMAMINDRLEG